MSGVEVLDANDAEVLEGGGERAQDVVVSVRDLGKMFRLPKEHSGELRRHIINMLHGEKGYTEFNVLRDVSFEVHRGDFFGIVGRNGSGKSTLLKLLSGIYRPTAGTISTVGRVVPFIELGVGFNPELTGAENVYLNGAMLGFSNAEITAMYNDIVAFAELEGFMDQKLKNYSSGMQVRLAFSVAIKAEADILILDEVLAVGDEAFQRKCDEYFQQVKLDPSKTVILVTHAMESVRAYCNRAILIENGEIALAGDPDQVASAYSRQFITQSEMSTDTDMRYGTGEVVIENVSHRLAEGRFVLDFDLVNKTDHDRSDLAVTFEFVTGGVVALGNSTRFVEPYVDGIVVRASDSEHFSVEFADNFGNRDFSLNMSLGDRVSEPLDVRKNVVEFSSANVEFKKSWHMVGLPIIRKAG
ncbi:MAG: ABC transporter ATP-binding protein [Propionibacteriaceae bacterium]|nr:ABC transporter ATP-binding protein [Propionibacteriaceae bacterium]